MKLGIVTPVAHMNPRFAPPDWEIAGTVQEVSDIVVAAERIGLDWVSCSEHIAIPADASTVRGGRYWDPFTTLGYLAARTSRIGLLTHMAVLPYHHPLELVKRLGTLDLLSGGRVIMGVGVGSLEEEFELLGHRFSGRGERADDAMAAIRAAWGKRVSDYDGPHYQFGGFIVEPSGLPRELALWVGGRTRRSLRRAIALGDAWMPFRLLEDELAEMLGDPEIVELRGARDRPLDLIFAPEPPLDPAGQPDAVIEKLAGYRALGATGLSLRFVHRSPAHYIEQMEAIVALVQSS